MYEKQRAELVGLLKSKGITSEPVLTAIGKVERHLFVPEAFRRMAYMDTPQHIGFGQTISQPYTVAVMTHALNPKKGDRILEIGTGSGYQAAILEEMGARVISIERHEELFRTTKKLLDSLGYNSLLFCGDGTLGMSEYAPYDGIIVTAGAPTVPRILVDQLAVGGRMVIPVGDKSVQSMTVILKKSETEFLQKEIPNFTFVPLVGKEGWNQA